MRDPLVKAYGHVYPVTPALYAALESALRDALNEDEDVPLLCQEGDMARISMEGAYFPEDDEDFVRRAHAVAAEQPGSGQNDEENQNGDGDDFVHSRLGV